MKNRVNPGVSVRQRWTTVPHQSQELRPLVSWSRFAVCFSTVTLLALMTGLSGCNPSNLMHTGGAAPAITFTTIPLVGADSPEKESPVKGRVIGARPRAKIVLYARGQTTWWVQPRADRPFTEIQKDATWSNVSHPGSEYAALLVDPSFQPPSTTDVLPTAGVYATAITRGALPFTQRWWFYPLCVFGIALVIFGVHQVRLHQLSTKLSLRFEERLAERVRVAQELHDTLLQGVLSASMQLHVVAGALPEESPARPALDHILQLMGQVIEEGRNTLRGLRSSIDAANDLQNSFSRIPQELGNQGVGFRVVVEGVALPLRSAIRDDVYRIGREALVNAFRHSGARNIDLHLEYCANQLRILVRDDGCGVDPQVLRLGRDGHWGLRGMRERAERISARFRVLSRAGGGTEVELRVPSAVAFESRPSGLASKVLMWVPRLFAESGRISKERAG